MSAESLTSLFKVNNRRALPMTMVPFDPTAPALNAARASAPVRNNLNALFDGDVASLRPRAQGSPNMTVAVAGCDVESFWRQAWVGSDAPLNFAGGNSSAVVAPSANPRIDLLTIDSAGALAWTVGTEAASPAPPSCPAGKIPVCYIYCRVGMTHIHDFEDDDASNGYIYRDVRPLINLGGGTPAGAIVMFGGAAAPAGWLLCDGSAVSQTTYAALFAVIGLAFGNPGGGNFNLPDLRQRFPLGKAASGTGSTLGGTGGEIDHHHHTNLTGGNAVVGGVYPKADSAILQSTAENPPFQAVNFMIKY
jgi:hypothetical protein